MDMATFRHFDTAVAGLLLLEVRNRVQLSLLQKDLDAWSVMLV